MLRNVVRTFIFFEVALSLSMPGVSASADTLQLPQDWGTVSESLSTSKTASSAKHLFLIQDIHSNYEAHQNIAQILDYLVREYDFNLIMVEGAEGDVGVSFTRAFGSPENMQKTADSLLQRGLIAGFEYLDMTVDYDLALWGVEDLALYKKNFQAYLSATEARETLEPFLQDYEQALQPLMDAVLPQAVVELRQAKHAFDHGEMLLKDYVALLAQGIDQAGLIDGAARRIKDFRALLALEQQVDVRGANAQQRALLETLRAEAPQDVLQSLRAGLESSEASPAFAKRLLVLASEFAPSADTQLLQAYVDFMDKQDQMDVSELLKAMDGVSRALVREWLDTPRQQQLHSIHAGLLSLRKLAAMKWTQADVEDYRAQQDEYRMDAWAGKVESIAQSAGVRVELPAVSDAVFEGIQQLSYFYEVADQRNQAMVERMLAKLETENEAAFVVGGFHTAVLTELLQQAGVAVTVITPLTGTPTDEALYDYAMKFKQGMYKDQPF